MKTFLFGLVIGILVVPLAVLTYFRSGSAPVADFGATYAV